MFFPLSNSITSAPSGSSSVAIVLNTQRDFSSGARMPNHHSVLWAWVNIHIYKYMARIFLAPTVLPRNPCRIHPQIRATAPDHKVSKTPFSALKLQWKNYEDKRRNKWISVAALARQNINTAAILIYYTTIWGLLLSLESSFK